MRKVITELFSFIALDQLNTSYLVHFTKRFSSQNQDHKLDLLTFCKSGPGSSPEVEEVLLSEISIAPIIILKQLDEEKTAQYKCQHVVLHTRKLNMSAYSSIDLVVGLPAPWPDLVSTRTIRGEPWAWE